MMGATDMHFDIVVIGGGTAGCILAARLSERAACRVLLIEAGVDFSASGATPACLLDASAPVMSGYNWDLQAIRRHEAVGQRLAHIGRAAKVLEVASNRLALMQVAPRMLGTSGDTLTRMNYPLAKTMGGGSAINGAIAMHASASDFDEWAGRGNAGWAWKNMQPYVERLRLGGQDRLPFVPEVPQEAHYTPLQRAFKAQCAELGFGFRADDAHNLVSAVVAIPKNTRGGERLSTADAYLRPARARKNLFVWSQCHADKLLFDDTGAHVVGVELLRQGQRIGVQAGKVVLSAGAIHSPAILMRSGIGPSEDLARLGIKAKIDLPGVGKNLQDHPFIALWALPAPACFVEGEPIHQLLLAHRSNGAAQCDLQLMMLGAVPTTLFPPLADFVRSDIATGISVVLAKPRSSGEVRLSHAGPMAAPRIVLNLLLDPQDRKAAMEGVRLAWKLMQGSKLRPLIESAVFWNDAMIEDDALLAAAIQTMVRASYHPVGTLKMGAPDDQLAVVDQSGRVRGCDNLFVADASIMPTIPHVPTNLTCMLIAEKLADHLIAESNVKVHERCFSP